MRAGRPTGRPREDRIGPPPAITAAHHRRPHFPPCRLRGPALACRRLHHLAHEPDLIGDVAVRVGDRAVFPCLESLCRWLSAHTPGVQRLLLDLGRHTSSVPGHVAAALRAALAVCGGSGGTLRCLRLSVPNDTLQRAAGWMASLGGLTALDCSSSNIHRPVPLELHPSLAPLSQLADLALGPVYLGTTRLPPSLTRLRLTHDYSDTMPTQVGAAEAGDGIAA